MPKYLVVARNYAQCNAWRMDKGIAKSDVTYLATAFDVRLAAADSLEGIELVLLQGYAKRKSEVYFQVLNKLRAELYGRSAN